MCVTCASLRPWSPECDHAALGAAGPSAVGAAPAPPDDDGVGSGKPMLSPGEVADKMLLEFWGVDAPRAFAARAGDALGVDLNALAAEGRALARSALAEWSLATGLRFSEVDGASADIAFDDARSGAYAFYSHRGSQIIRAQINVAETWIGAYGTGYGSYGFQTYLHEIGHALGLGHTGRYNGSADYARDAEFANDSWQMSVMSYFDQRENTALVADRAYAVTPMAGDLAAVRRLYGEAPAREGDTVYLEGSTAGGALDLVAGAPRALTFTIHDTGGTDLVQLGLQIRAQRLDLRGGAVSDVLGWVGNMVIAEGTVIERAALGSGDDMVTGNAAANELRGNAGRDRIEGREGHDVLDGGDGDDDLHGGAFGEELASGDDTLLGGAGDDTLHGGDGADLLDGGAGDDALHGDAGRDALLGGDGADVLHGGEGDDALDGGPGADRLAGEAGDDTLTGGEGLDIFAFGGLFGIDTVADFALGDRIEVDLTGGLRFAGFAREGSNSVLNFAGADGPLAIQLLNHALHAAEIAVDGILLVVEASARPPTPPESSLVPPPPEAISWPSPAPMPPASASEPSPRQVEPPAPPSEDVVPDAEPRKGARLAGGLGDDALRGGRGPDVLRGGAGADRLRGGAGDDDLRGNRGGDTLWGGAGDDRAFGGAGRDLLMGQGGNDRLRGGSGDDRVVGNRGHDTLLGGAGDDVLKGGAGRDILRGDGGRDVLTGGSGRDRFVFADGFGRDRIRDFDAQSDAETIDLSNVSAVRDFADLLAHHARQKGEDACIRAGDDRLILEGIDLDDLGTGDFVF